MTKTINWSLLNICAHTPELGSELPWGYSFIAAIKWLILRPLQSRLKAAPPDPGSGPGFCLPLLHLLLTDCCSTLTKLNPTTNKTGPNYVRMLLKANFNFGVKTQPRPPPPRPDAPRELSPSGVGWWRLIGLLWSVEFNPIKLWLRALGAEPP